MSYLSLKLSSKSWGGGYLYRPSPTQKSGGRGYIPPTPPPRIYASDTCTYQFSKENILTVSIIIVHHIHNIHQAHSIEKWRTQSWDEASAPPPTEF